MKAHTQVAPYKLAKVYIGPNEWHLEFYYYSLDKEKYIRDKVRLKERGLSIEEKKAKLEHWCIEFNKILKERNKLGLYHEAFVKKKTKFDPRITIPEALVYVKNSKDDAISEDRASCLQETAGIFNVFYKAHDNFSSLRITALNEDFIKFFVKWCKQEKKAGKTINKYLSTIQYATEWLKKKKHIAESFDTVSFRVAQPKNETGRFPPLTHEEKVRAFDYFQVKDPNYYLFLFWIYYTCVRGSEIYRIQREQLNFKNRTIHLPFLDTKNGNSNYVQMLEPLYLLMLEMNIDKLKPHVYLFGNNFLPSEIEYEGPQSSNKWFNHRDNMNMPKKKQAYGLKHTFNVDYVENNKYNLDWEWLRRHNRHATIQQTQDYISELTAYFLDETKNIIIDYRSKK
jgi:integrase